MELKGRAESKMSRTEKTSNERSVYNFDDVILVTFFPRIHSERRKRLQTWFLRSAMLVKLRRSKKGNKIIVIKINCLLHALTTRMMISKCLPKALFGDLFGN